MQNKYVGDIGDFGKYGLLRALCRKDVHLGVVWYLNPSEKDNKDGSLVRYLEKDAPGLESCDPDLFIILKGLVQNRKRSVSAIRGAGLLHGAVFVEKEVLPEDGASLDRRRVYRKEWHERALQDTARAGLVFLDPDNGFSDDSARKHTKRAAKYVFRDELESYLRRGQSVILYQHQTRKGTLDEQVQDKMKLFKRLSVTHEVWALTYHRQQVRIYFVFAARDEHVLKSRTGEFMKGSWQQHFWRG